MPVSSEQNLAELQRQLLAQDVGSMLQLFFYYLSNMLCVFYMHIFMHNYPESHFKNSC